MIFSFRSAEAESIFQNRVSRKLPVDIQTTALRKLLLLHAAPSLNTLRVPRGNQLEALKGNRAGQHSIRINDQWRICFVWQEADDDTATPAGARDVEIVDYH
jgi:proteic killer suppression protein